MKLNAKQILLGAAIGYIMRDQISATLEKVQMGALHLGALQLGGMHMNGMHMGAIKLNPHSAFAQTQASPRAAFGPEGYGIHHNPAHLGALQMNPAHLGAVHMNPKHMGAVHLNALHM